MTCDLEFMMGTLDENVHPVRETLLDDVKATVGIDVVVVAVIEDVIDKAGDAMEELVDAISITGDAVPGIGGALHATIGESSAIDVSVVLDEMVANTSTQKVVRKGVAA